MSESDSESESKHSRYKSQTTEKDTRNPTTNKKIHGTPLRRAPSNHQDSHWQRFCEEQDRKNSMYQHKGHSLRQSLIHLKTHKERLVKAERYGLARSIDQSIKRTKSLLAKNQIKKLNFEHRRVKEEAQSAYRLQLFNFNKIWQHYFDTLRSHSKSAERQLRRSRDRSLQEIHQKLGRKCVSLRNKCADLIHLERKEQLYLKDNNYQELSRIKKQKKKTYLADISRKQAKMKEWYVQQKQKILMKQSKKYAAFMSRVAEHRTDKEKLYLREQKRLKQKYKNYIVKLNHQQALQIYNTNKMLEVAF